MMCAGGVMSLYSLVYCSFLFLSSLDLPLSPSLQDIEETMNTALNELRELERQSSAKHAPDVVLDTLEQRQSTGGPTPASSSESRSFLLL